MEAKQKKIDVGVVNVHVPYIEFLQEIAVLIGALCGIGGIVYWVLKKKLEDEFVKKTECAKQHDEVKNDLQESRNGTKEMLSEINVRLKDLQDKFYEYITRK